MKKRGVSLVLVLCLLCLVSCGEASVRTSNFFVMDTLCELRLYGELDHAQDVISGCKALAENLEKVFSATREDSELARFHALRSGEFSTSFAELTAYSLMLSELTGGAFDITVGNALTLWEKSVSRGEYPSASALSEALEGIGYEKVDVDGMYVAAGNDRLTLHFGGIAKGYAADRMVEYLKAGGVESGMVTFVSSISVYGEREFQIGLRAPDAADGLCGTVTLRDTSLSVSGNYERFYEIDGGRYGHILDPRTALPADSGLHSVAVIADSAALADALSTAIYVMGVREGAALYERGVLDFEFICLSEDGAWASPGMSAVFEPDEARYHPEIVGE